ncbi:MAG TPA: cupin domain-containing protein [Capillimicrobium sp.]|nr:cupin domain-containing protein [Capillimicrobium sp.]
MPDTYQLTPHETVTVVERSPERLVVEAAWTKGSPPPAHQHPQQDERFTVLEGEITYRIDGQERVAREGDVFDVPRRTAHAMWNASDGPARVRWETMPAARTEEFWTAVSTTSRRNPVAMGKLLVRFRDTFRLARG